MHKSFYNKKYTISNFIRKKTGIKFIFLKSCINKKNPTRSDNFSFKYFISSEFFFNFIECRIKDVTLNKYFYDLNSANSILNFGQQPIYIPFNSNFIFNDCYNDDEPFYKDTESLLLNSIFFNKFVKNTQKKNFNNLILSTKKSFLSMYLLDEVKNLNLNKNDSNAAKLFNLTDKKNNLITIQQRLVLLKKQKGNIYYGLPEVFNYASILLFNNIDSLTTVVPMFYFVSALYN